MGMKESNMPTPPKWGNIILDLNEVHGVLLVDPSQGEGTGRGGGDARRCNGPRTPGAPPGGGYGRTPARGPGTPPVPCGPTLGEGVGHRRADRRPDDPHALGAEHLVEGTGELGVPVPDQEPDHS